VAGHPAHGCRQPRPAGLQEARERGAADRVDGGLAAPAGDRPRPSLEGGTGGDTGGKGGGGPVRVRPRRFHGTITLDPGRTGRDASKVADEVISHLVALVGAEVTITLDITAQVPDGVPENVVRIVTENCRTLKFDEQGFETE